MTNSATTPSKPTPPVDAAATVKSRAAQATKTKPAKKGKPAAAVKPEARSAAPTAAVPVAKKQKSAKPAAPVAAKSTLKRATKSGTPPEGKAPKAKLKLVRDSFTMPQADFDLIDVLKQRALNFRHSAKKSELLRAGLQVLAALPQAELQATLERITSLKPGRPKKID
jgi:hypothetical protein